MKKVINCMVASTLIISLSLLASDEKQLNSELTTAYGRIFRPPLLLSINAQNITQWNKIVDKIGGFIKKNITLDKNLTNGLQVALSANTTVTTILEEWNRLINKGVVDMASKKQSATILEGIEKQVQAEYQKGSTKSYILPGNTKANNALLLLLSTLRRLIYSTRQELLTMSPKEAENVPRLEAFKALGLDKSATDEQIKTQYKKLSLKYHPDRQVRKPDKEKEEAGKMFRIINNAYQCLIINPKECDQFENR